MAFFFTEFVFSNNIMGIVQRQQHDEWRQQNEVTRDEC